MQTPLELPFRNPVFLTRFFSQLRLAHQLYLSGAMGKNPLIPFQGKDQLVDGWHRLYLAALMGVDELLAYFLTQEEADACLIARLPPGRGFALGPTGKEQTT